MIKLFLLNMLLPLRERWWAMATFDDHWIGDWPDDVQKYHLEKYRKLEAKRKKERLKKRNWHNLNFRCKRLYERIAKSEIGIYASDMTKGDNARAEYMYENGFLTIHTAPWNGSRIFKAKGKGIA